MSIVEFESQLTELFTETATAHHEAFAATDGNDPEWPIWYAEYLQEPISEILQNRFLKSSLIYCMMNADFDYTAREVDVPWQKFYSDRGKSFIPIILSSILLPLIPRQRIAWRFITPPPVLSAKWSCRRSVNWVLKSR
jgi:hypothetical protein